jgi:hypothetical protein
MVVPLLCVEVAGVAPGPAGLEACALSATGFGAGLELVTAAAVDVIFGHDSDAELDGGATF